MSTLVTILLAMVMEVIAPTPQETIHEIKSSHRVEVEDVLFNIEAMPILTPSKKC